MRIIRWLSVVAILLGATALFAADELQDSLAALASEDSSTYDKAVKFLSKHRQEAEPSLLAILHDNSKPALARLRAVKLLGDFGDKSAAGDVQQALYSGSESNEAIRVEMIRTLSKLGSNGSLIDYLNKRKEHSPSVNAAIAIGLQGRTDEESKKALGDLLRNDDPRVFRAALRATSKTYEPITSPNPTNTNQPSPVKDTRPEIAATVSAEKLTPTAGDQAIFQALQAQRASKDSQISQQAADLLDKLSQRYKQ